MAEYCLRWNNHQPNLVTVFSELLNAESLVDVTLATDGNFIHAHKLVLSACSVYFKDLFGSNPCKHPIVFLKDIRFEDLKTVIDYIYRGEVNVSQERLQDVLKTAESLRIKGLADKPFTYDDYPSQTRGQHLSSSLSSQRSSLTDSREQAQSVDNEEGIESASGNNSQPASKKRKVASSQDSTESLQQDTNHEGEENLRSEGKEDAPSLKKGGTPSADTEEGAARTCPKEKIKVEKDVGGSGSTEPRPEFQESSAAGAMLMLQGSSSEGGEESGPSSLSLTSGSRDTSAGLISSHSQGRPKRAMLQRQPGIFREGATEEGHEDPGPTPSSPEYIVPDSITLTLTTESPAMVSASTGENESLLFSSGTITSTTSSHPSASSKMLQVPAVVVGPHQDKSSSYATYGGPLQKQTGSSKPLLVIPTSTGRSPQQITKQRSQPELSMSYVESTLHPFIKKEPLSHPTVLTHTPPSTNAPEQITTASSSSANTTSSCSSSSFCSVAPSSCSSHQHSQQPMAYIPVPLIKKQRSSPGSLPSPASHLRPIQPKPPLGSEKDHLPTIQFTVSEDDSPGFQARFPTRAISEEPVMNRGSLDHLLSPGVNVPLTQSVSQDTGLDGGLAFMNRIMSASAASQQNLTVPKLSSGGGGGCSSSSTSSSSVPHAPVLREGPALGCNYCWNSQDNHGRVQRRKTKYHCPACRTNLCIVPCFHEFHNQMQMHQDQQKQFTKILTKTSST